MKKGGYECDEDARKSSQEWTLTQGGVKRPDTRFGQENGPEKREGINDCPC